MTGRPGRRPGLEEDRRDRVRTLEEDLLLDLVAAQRPHALGSSPKTGARYRWVGHPERAGDQGLEDVLEGRETGDRQRPLGGAVVGDRPSDDLGLHRLAGQLEVLLGRLPRGLDGLAATGGEEDAVQV